MDRPQRIALPASWVHIITAKIIAVWPATAMAITFQGQNATNVIQTV